MGKGPSTPTSTRTFKEPGPGFGKGRLGQGQDKVDGPPGESSQGSVILRLKKRFLKEQDSSRVFFMKRQIRLNKLREVGDSVMAQSALFENVSFIDSLIQCMHLIESILVRGHTLGVRSSL